MTNYKKIIDKFLQQRKSQNRLAAVCIYGSRVQGTAKEASDLDVYLITVGGQDYRGSTVIDGITIEYFEKAFTTIMREIEANHENFNSFYQSFFRNCLVLYEEGSMFSYLKEFSEKVQMRPLLPGRLTASDQCDLHRTQMQFYESGDKKLPFYNHAYYVYLECLRQKYHKLNGYSNIPARKVQTLYTNDQIAQNYCVSLPGKSYRDFFIESILNENCSREEKQEKIKRAMQYISITSSNEESSKKGKINLEGYYIALYHQIQALSTTTESSLYQYHNIVDQLNQFYAMLCANTSQEVDDDLVDSLIMEQGNVEMLQHTLQNFGEEMNFNVKEYCIPYFSKNRRFL